MRAASSGSALGLSNLDGGGWTGSAQGACGDGDSGVLEGAGPVSSRVATRTMNTAPRTRRSRAAISTGFKSRNQFAHTLPFAFGENSAKLDEGELGGLQRPALKLQPSEIIT
jgi:hypothetical protein